MLTLREVHAEASTAELGRIEALLHAFGRAGSGSDGIRLALAGMRAAVSNDLAAAIGLLKGAASRANDAFQPYAIDLLVPLLKIDGQADEMERFLSMVVPPPHLASAFDAARAIVLAMKCQDTESEAISRRASDGARMSDDVLMLGRVLQRVAVAAYYRWQFDDSREDAIKAAITFERIGRLGHAARAYSVLYVISHDWCEDFEDTMRYAALMAERAHVAGDLTFERMGLLNQLETLAEAGETVEYASLRSQLLQGPADSRYRGSRASWVISECLWDGWSDRFDRAFAGITTFRGTDLPLVDRSLCDALLAVLAIATGDADHARRLSRRVIGETCEPQHREPLHDWRRRRIARTIAAMTCIAIGDVVRGRRALSRTFDRSQTIANAVSESGVAEHSLPRMIRGYARFVDRAIKAAMALRPPTRLTPAELDVLAALRGGTTLSAVAFSMGKSKKTVQCQVASIYAKLEVSNRTRALQRASELGIDAHLIL
jgi:DNA-binding CsgD family transcriptional regulator